MVRDGDGMRPERDEGVEADTWVQMDGRHGRGEVPRGAKGWKGGVGDRAGEASDGADRKDVGAEDVLLRPC